MASYFHCMTCLAFFSKDNKFYISTCSHIACKKCVEKGAFTLQCKLCKKENPQIQEVSGAMKKEFRELFTPMAETVRVGAQSMTQVLQFQHAQRNNLISQLYTRFENFEKMRNFCEETVKKKNQYKNQIIQLQQYNTKAKDCIRNLQEKMAKQQSQRRTDETVNNMNLTAMTHDPFRTPAPPRASAYRSFITSTPCENISGGFGRDNTTDATMSFTAATGLPKSKNTTDGESKRTRGIKISLLAQRTEGVHLDSTTLPTQSFASTMSSGGMKRVVARTEEEYRLPNSMTPPALNNANSTPINSVKKCRIDIVGRTDPLVK